MNRKFLSLLLVNVAVLCPSLRAQHLWWNLEGQRDATCLYGEITVLENFLGRDKAAVKLAIFRDAGGAAGVDLDQEFYDDSLVTERDKVYEIHAAPYAALLWTGQ